jgi:ribosomal protein S18 acetylase RimI-like enzyme
MLDAMSGALGEVGMQIDLTDTPLRVAGTADWKQVADITAEAFSEDPVTLWMSGNAQGVRSSFGTLARRVYGPQGFCCLAGDEGATMWVEPGKDVKLSPLTLALFVLGQMRYGTPGVLRRSLDLMGLMEQHHPREPHMYLFTIGTRKSARGKGLGKALLAPVLAACDREGVPVYLENSNPANSGFYAAHGFERRAIFEIGPGGPVMEPMWRAPKA